MPIPSKNTAFFVFFLFGFLPAAMNAKLVSHVVTKEHFIGLTPNTNSKFVTITNKMNNTQYVKLELSETYIDESGVLRKKENTHKPNATKQVFVSPAKMILHPKSKKKFRVTFIGENKTDREFYFVIFNKFVPEEKAKAKKKIDQDNDKPKTASIMVQKIINSRVLVIIPAKKSKLNHAFSFDNHKVTIKNNGNGFFRVRDFKLCDIKSCKPVRLWYGKDIFPGHSHSWTAEKKQSSKIKSIKYKLDYCGKDGTILSKSFDQAI